MPPCRSAPGHRRSGSRRVRELSEEVKRLDLEQYVFEFESDWLTVVPNALPKGGR